MPPIRVLVADDHAIVRSGLRRLLEAQPDMDVVAEAEDGETAVRLAGELRPDVLLTDISMPGANGIQIIERVAALSPDTRVLVLTMHDDPAYLRSALASGAAGYMIKTGVDVELLTAIRTVYRGRSYIDVSLADEALQHVLSQKAKQRRSNGCRAAEVLSGRERQVLELVAYGHTHKEIARQLDVSIKSVETYRARLMEKLGLKNRVDLVRYALDSGILGPEKGPTVR